LTILVVAAAVVLLYVPGLAVGGIEPRKGWPALFLAFLFFMGWVAFAMPTVCDVQNLSNNYPCSNNCYGVLRACQLRRHKQIKRAFILSWFGIQTKSFYTAQRLVPSTPRQQYRPTPQPVGGNARLGRDLYDKTIFGLTLVSTLCAICSLPFWQK
jgi:hypothetical protein